MLFLLAVTSVLVLTGVGAAIADASAPAVITRPATALGPTSAVLQGVVNPKDKSTAYTFEYGTTTAYGALSPAASAGNGKSDVPVSYALSGLAPSTTYHYRLVASNDSGTSRGADVAFTTAPAPNTPGTPTPAPFAPGTTPSTPGSAPATATDAAPVLGERVNVAPAAGTVLVRAPGATSSIPLSGAASIPVGAILDTRKGSVDLTTALPGGQTQSATVHGGLFQVRQPASGRGMTELRLRGAKPSCPSRTGAHGGDRQAAPAPRAVGERPSRALPDPRQQRGRHRPRDVVVHGRPLRRHLHARRPRQRLGARSAYPPHRRAPRGPEPPRAGGALTPDPRPRA